MDQVGHLTGGDVVVAERGVGLRVSGEVAVEAAGGVPEEGLVIPRNAAVGVELDEDPRGTVLHEWAKLRPKMKTLERGGIRTREVGVLDAGDEAELAALPVETQRSLDKEEVIETIREALCGAGADGCASAVRNRATVLMSVVNGIDGADLCGVRSRGQSEVCVASGGFENG